MAFEENDGTQRRRGIGNCNGSTRWQQRQPEARGFPNAEIVHVKMATMNEITPESVDAETRVRWSPRLRGRDLFILGSVSVLLFLWTGHPAIGAVLPLLLSGRKCWNVGWWLYDRDPDRRRATTVLMFYIALAGWQAGAAAFSSLVGFIILEENGWFKIPEDRIMWTLAMLFLALVWNAALCSVALIRALRHSQKIWLSPTIVTQCEGDFTQLAYLELSANHLNRAVFVIAAGVGFPALLVFVVPLGLMAVLAGANPVQGPVTVTLGLIMAGGMIIVPLVLVLFLIRRIAARAPWQCWKDRTQDRITAG